MAAATFFFKEPPVVVGIIAIVRIRADETDPGSIVILDHDVGDSHEVFVTAGATPEEQALAGTKALVADIGGRRGLSLSPSDVTQIPAP